MHRFDSKAFRASRLQGYYHITFVCALMSAVILLPSIAWADDDEVKPAPRTAVIIGGASVVLVATTDRLYAFVDRIEDNSPLADAQLSVDTADGDSINLHRAPLNLNKTTEGMFVGPLNRVGQMQGAFMVSLQSSAGSGDVPAEIIYSDVRPPAMIGTEFNLAAKLGIAGVAAGIGAILTMIVMVWARSRSKSRSVPTAGTATIS